MSKPTTASNEVAGRGNADCSVAGASGAPSESGNETYSWLTQRKPSRRPRQGDERGVVGVVADVLVRVVEDPVAPGDHQVALELRRDDDVVQHGVLGQGRAEVGHLPGGRQEARPVLVDRQQVREPHGRDPLVSEEAVQRRGLGDGGQGGGAAGYAEKLEETPP
jgi:hypothetical protein